MGVYRRASMLMDWSGSSKSSKWRARQKKWASGFYRLLCLSCGLVGCLKKLFATPIPSHYLHLFHRFSFLIGLCLFLSCFTRQFREVTFSLKTYLLSKTKTIPSVCQIISILFLKLCSHLKPLGACNFRNISTET